MDVDVRRVSKVFGTHRALWRASLTFPSGSTTALLGPNGAGKSTLLWLCSTLGRPTSGEIRVGRWTGADLRRARGAIGFVAHTSMTYGELTGRENLELFATLSALPRPADVARRWLSAVALEFAADRAAKTYSRGMRQRLALGRALIADPPVLLLDEPFSGLDLASRAQVGELLRARRGAGTTIVATHDLAQAARLADRAVLLRNGRVIRTEEGMQTVESLQAWFTSAVTPGPPTEAAQ
ncbi:MAG TPA: ABC transporter ATP-binding protein [Myxococcales bacterium LLY-WYZ-16_1]|nr:ABC transporter ATP-binding protein [Myxococcales bacterium LLY-WYZ-16_1]